MLASILAAVALSGAAAQLLAIGALIRAATHPHGAGSLPALESTMRTG